MPIADLLAGMYGAFGVVAALHERERTGLGRVVRTSLLAAMVGVHAFQGTRWTVAGEVGQAQGNHHPSIVPVRPVPLRRTAPSRSPAAVGGAVAASRRSSGSTPTRTASRPTPSGSPTATRWSS